MFNYFERWMGPKQLPLPNDFESVDLLSLDDVNKKLLKTQIKKNSGVVDVLVHPYFREKPNAGVSPFPMSPLYIENRDIFIRNKIEAGDPLIIFEEAKKCSVLAERINAKKGIIYWVATCEGDSTPSTIKDDPRFEAFMHIKTKMKVENEAWDKIGKELS